MSKQNNVQMAKKVQMSKKKVQMIKKNMFKSAENIVQMSQYSSNEQKKN